MPKEQFISTAAIDKKVSGAISPRLQSFLERTAQNSKSWTAAKKNPLKFLSDSGFTTTQFKAIKFGEVAKPSVSLKFPPRRCPVGFYPVHRLVKKRICLRWVMFWIHLPGGGVIHFERCLWWFEYYVYEVKCVRIILKKVPRKLPKKFPPKRLIS